MLKMNRLIILLLLISTTQISFSKEADKADVRVLIDISGSMKANDPENLRRPALRMLVGLMQPGTRAGVWTFAKWVNMLVPLAEVDADWKEKAISLSHDIGSPGQFTNIEEVLKRAISDWDGGTTRYRRHIVLLTDGVVDISKISSESAASRKRILEKLLPEIKKYGAQIHAIALSERADHELLKRLSSETGGWYKQTNTAGELQKLFLRIFEKVGKPDTVPLKGNKFKVDKSIKEVTILVFRASGSKSATLVTPSGQKMSGGKRITGVGWHEDTGYDLITISQPEPGEWTLDADIDPSNRVMVVTDLKLEVSALPNRLAVTDRVNVSAALNSEGKRVTKQKFLKLVKVKAETDSDQGKTKQAINDNGKNGDDKAGDASYSFTYSEGLPIGEVELLIEIKSPTFERQKRHLFNIVEPAELSLIDDDKTVAFNIDLGVMQEAGLEIKIWQEVDGEKQSLEKTIGAEKGDWIATDINNNAPVYASLEGKTSIGNLLTQQFGPLYPAGSAPPPILEEIDPFVEPIPEPIPEIEVEAIPMEEEPEPIIEIKKIEPVVEEKKPEPIVEEEPIEEEPIEEEDNFLITALIFGGANLLIFGGGFLGWRFMKNRKPEDDLSLDDEMPPSPDSTSVEIELDDDLNLDDVEDEVVDEVIEEADLDELDDAAEDKK